MDNLSEFANIILSLIAIFQWWDRRSKNRAIENFVSATQNMSFRLQQQYPKNTIVYQKAVDIIENCKAINNTIKNK